MAGRVICARFPGFSWPNAKLKPPVSVTSRFQHVSPNLPVTEASSAVQYPPILDLSPEAKKQREVARWADHIKSLPSVEQKLYELNMPRYYGWWTCHLSDETLFYDSSSMLKLITRSKMENGLPAEVYQSGLQSHIESVLPSLKSALADTLSLYGPRSEGELALGIHRTLLRVLGSVEAGSHLRYIESSPDPRVEAFWTVGGINPDKHMIKSKKNLKIKLPEERVNAPVNRPFQYISRPLLLLRGGKPLKAVSPLENGAGDTGNEIVDRIPDPRAWGYLFKLRHGTNLPGHWPSADNQFGFVSWLKQGEEHSGMSAEDTRQAQALQHLFGWTLAQATYLGFGPYTESSVPVRSQCLILKGTAVSAHNFQLSTCRLHDQYSLNNSRTNLLQSSNIVELCHSLDGPTKGVNEEAIRLLASVYLQVPEASESELAQYLATKKLAADTIQDEKKRTELLESFFHMYSNRPRHIERPEIFMWEKIYKVDNNTRIQDPRRRFFELGENPLDRRYDDRRYKVLPRHMRDPPKKSRRGRLPVIPTIKL